MGDSKDPVKPWERPWTTDEMRQQSASWNLAGDSGLLRHLQQFSQNLLAQTHATEVTLDSLMEQLRATSTDVSNVTNQFLCLSNTQFLENRVYDDDEDDEKGVPPEEKKEEAKQIKSKEEQEAEVVARVREALTLGISILDNMFDTVEVPASDSEDEESGGRLVLEPHNPYLSQALPYLIGSQPFMEDDHVGLGSPSDSEEEDADKHFIHSSESESESEMDIEQQKGNKKRTRFSVSGSENSEFDGSDGSGGEGPAPGKQKKMEASGLFDSTPAAHTGDMFGGDSPIEDVAVVEDDVVTRDSFAAELTDKLGVAAASITSDQQAPKSRTAGKSTLEWYEDDDNSLFGEQVGKFSGGQGLFDGVEDTSGSLWNTKDKLNADKGVKKPSGEASLFGSDTGFEDGIFDSAADTEKTKRLLRVATTGVLTSTPETWVDVLGLSNDCEISNIKTSPVLDGDLFAAPVPTSRDSVQVIVDQQHSIKKKNRAGAESSVFGGVNVFKAGVRRPPSSSSCSSDGTVPTFEYTDSISSGIGQTRSEQQDSTKSLGISAANNVSLFGGSDYLFDPVPTSRNDHSAVVIKNEKIPPEAVTASDLFRDESTGDSVLSKPQKGLAPCSGKPTTEGDSVRRVGTASRKPFSLFNDSDSGDDELLFSSTSSTSSRSRRSQGSGDLLTEPGDKGRPTTVPRKGLFDNEDLFGGAKDEPYFDIFSTGANTAIVKPNSLPEQNKNGNEDLFSEQLNDPEFNLFKPFNTTPEKLKSDDKDALFGDDGSRIDSKPGKSIAQVSDSHSSFKDSGSVKPSWGLFSDSGSDDTHDIFAVPVNKAHRELSPSKATLVNSLFSGGSVLEDSKVDLFAGPVKAKNESKDISETDGFLDKIDDIFSVSRTASSSKVGREKKVINGHYAASDSEFVTESESARKDEFAEVSGEVSDVISSGIFSEVRDENGSDLFNRSTANPSVNTKPVIANKPVISPKPKLSPVSKPPLLQDTAKGSGDLSSKMNTDENILQLSNPTNTKERSDNLSAKSGQKIEVHDSFAERTERLISPGSSVPPSKLRPPKTLNIRKSTGLLFSSSSNEDEDLFGMSVPEKVLMDSNSAKAVDQKPISNLVIVQPQCSSVDVARPVSFSAEKCANSGKEISSKVGCSQDSNDNSTAKARSVGASPRHLNIDPVALLIGVRPSRNVEAAVSFDEPAQFSATLHNAGKDRARIQAKRRPPSRRARKEAVRLSGIDHDGSETASVMAAEKVPNPAPDKSDDIQEPVARTAEAPGLSSTESQPPASHTVGSLSKPRSSSFLDGSSNLLSPSTDEEDLFGVPQDLPSEYGSNKDDGQNLFSYAPVLSPLDSLLKFPAESDPSKCVAIDTGGKFSTSDVLHTSKLLEDSSDKMPAVRTSPTSSNGSNMAVPNMSSGSHDIRVTGPPLHTLHGSLHNCDENDDSNDLFSETKKTVPSSRKDKQDLFDTTRNSESLFASEKSIPELDVSNYLPEGTGILSDCPENARPLSKDYLSSKYPLPVDDEKPPVPENIMQSNAQEELFGSGYLKHDLFTPRKGSSEKVDDDMFLTSNMDNSICSDSGDELFSVGTNSSLNKDNKNKSDITKPKEICDIDENILFSSGDKQKQPLPTQKNLFSNNAKDINTPKLAVSETGSNSGLFGGDSPESDDIFFDISSKKKAANAIMKGKLSGVVTSSAKGSLFGGDDDDDDIFGSDKSASKSAVFPKPAIAPLDDADALFVSGLTKKKPQTKLNRPTGSSSSRQTVTAEGDLFEDPLMVVTKKLCSNERKVVWKRVVREIHPIYEVEHIRKHLAFKKMSEKVKLRQKLAEKEEEIHIREHDLEQAHMKLKVLNCQMQAIKQRMKDLGMKTLILRFKKHELENEATRLEELCQVANFFRQPVESGCGDPHSSCTKHVETACENAIYECKAQILELHKLYKMKDVNMQILHSKKESVMEFVHYRMKDFSILNVWRTLLNSVDQLNKELHNLTQSNVRMESEHMHAVKGCIDSEMKKFMKSYVELFAAYHSLQHKMKQCSSDCDILFDRTVEMLQEEWRGYKFGDVFQECGRIRQWLELQSKFTEFGIINEVLQNEIKNLKVNTYSTDLDILNLQEEEIKRLGNEIETLRADLRTNSLWLTKSHAGQIETAEKLKQEITKLSQTCALDKCGMTTLDASVKGLRGAFQHELKEFMALPIHLLDNIALPSGSVLPSNQQILKYHNNLMNVDQLHGLTGILTALEGAPSAAPHGITLQLLEKTLYLSFLNTTEMDSNELNSSLAVLDISSKENAATTAVTEVMKVAEKSIEECKIVAERAKANYRTWLEHPLRHAVPESLQIDEKNFQQWQREYDSLLASLIDLESEEEVSYMV